MHSFIHSFIHSDSEESKKSCSIFLPESDKFYHKLVVKSKTTGKRFGVCVRTTSFDSEDNYDKGVFNSKKECKSACGFSGAGKLIELIILWVIKST
jgi:hypothetical protein